MQSELEQQGFGVDYSHATIPDDCTVYKVHTKAPKGLGNFDRLVSAKSSKEARETWKRLYSYMGNTVKIVSVTPSEDPHDKVYDLGHSNIIGRLTIKPRLFMCPN